MKIYGFRSKKMWKMGLASIFYLTVLSGVSNALVEDDEQEVAQVQKEDDKKVKVENVKDLSEDKEKYLNVTLKEIESIHFNFDGGWNANFKDGLVLIGEGNFLEGKNKIRALQNQYKVLEEKLEKIEVPKDKEIAKEFKEYVNSMKMAIYYRVEASKAVINMVNQEISVGKAQDEIQENIQNSTAMMITALSHLSNIETKLDIEDGGIVNNK